MQIKTTMSSHVTPTRMAIVVVVVTIIIIIMINNRK